MTSRPYHNAIGRPPQSSGINNVLYCDEVLALKNMRSKYSRGLRELSVATFVGWCVAIAMHLNRRAEVHAPLDELPLFAPPLPPAV